MCHGVHWRLRRSACDWTSYRNGSAAESSLIQGSLTYRDQRLNGFEAAAIVEVIEHLDAPRLATFERIVFEFARPTHVVLTTPNAEYNTVFETFHQESSDMATTASSGSVLNLKAGQVESQSGLDTGFDSSR